MAVELGTAYVSIVPSASGIGKTLATELGAPLTAAGAAGGKNVSKSFASTLSSGLGKATLPLVGVGVAAIASAKSVQDAQNTILRATGASGKAADGLLASFKNVAKGSAAPLATVASTLAEVSQRTGLVGKPLEGLTSQILTFNRITKDAPIGVKDLTQTLAGFRVPADQSGKALDTLFTISQKTGVPLAELNSTLGSSGAILRQFRLPLDQSASLLAKLDKAGVPASAAMGGLKKAFTTFAKEGKDPKTALIGVLGQIDALVKSGDKAGAQQLGAKIFGARGVGLVDAAIQGKLAIGDLTKTVPNLGKGIKATASETSTMAGKLGVLKNNAQLALANLGGPLLDAANSGLKVLVPVIQNLATGFSALPGPVKGVAVSLVAVGAVAGPVTKLAAGIGKIGKAAFGAAKGLAGAAKSAVTFFTSGKASSLAKGLFDAGKSVLTFGKNALIAAGNVVKQTAAFVASKVASFAAAAAQKALTAAQWLLNAAMTANPVGLIVAGIAALAAGIFIAYKKFGPFRAVVDAVWQLFQKVFNWIKGNWPKLLLILTGPIGIGAALIIKNFGTIKAVVVAAFNWIKRNWPLLLAIITGPIGLAVLIITKYWDAIKSGIQNVKAAIVHNLDLVVNFVTGLPGRIASAVSGLWDGLAEGFKSAINVIIRAWNSLDFTVGAFDPPGPGKFGGFTVGVPDIPLLDNGGIVRKPTLAFLSANSRPEAVIPLSRMQSASQPSVIVQFGTIIGDAAYIERVAERGTERALQNIATRRGFVRGGPIASIP